PTLMLPPLPPVPPVAPVVRRSLASASLPLTTVARPPPPPIDCAKMPTALYPEVLTLVAPTNTVLPLPPPPPQPLRVRPTVPLLSPTLPATPPPPPGPAAPMPV